jgi:hypothetical protein
MYQSTGRRSARGCVMAWKATGQPTVRKQRDKWVVRVDGIDTATGKHRPRQLGRSASDECGRVGITGNNERQRVLVPQALDPTNSSASSGTHRVN